MQEYSEQVLKNREIKKLRLRRKIIKNIFSIIFYAIVIYMLWYVANDVWQNYVFKDEPSYYTIADIKIPSFANVNESLDYVKNIGKSDIDGDVWEVIYNYEVDEPRQEDIKSYTDMLTSELNAEAREINQNFASMEIPTSDENTKVDMKLTLDGNVYKLRFKKREIEQEKLEPPVIYNISEEKAEEILLSLTKKETGFTANIDIYSRELKDELVDIDGWKYYEFEIIADYSETRKEYRGTFYISCDDGMVLKYNRNTKGTIYLREGIIYN